MSLELLSKARQAMKTEERVSLSELAQSALRAGGLASLSLFWSVALGYTLPSNVTPAKVITGLLAAGTGVATLLALHDLGNDLEDWTWVNSSQTRSEWRTRAFQAEMNRFENHWVVQKQTGPIQPESAPPAAQTNQEPMQLWDVSAIARPLKSSIIVGQPGAGKGLLIAHGIRHAKVQNPDLRVWAVPVKDDPGEAHRWTAADYVFREPLKAFAGAEGVSLWTSQLNEFLAGFSAYQGPKLLVLDEALAIKEKTGKWFRDLMANLNHLASTGRSQQCYVWLASQTANASDFGISGGARNVFRRVMLVSREDPGLLLNRTTFSQPLENAQQALSVTGRVVFDSLGGWQPFPGLTEPTEGTPEQAQINRLEFAYQSGPGGAEGELLEWLTQVGPKTVRDIAQTWARRRPENSEAIRGLLASLETQGLVRCVDGVYQAS